MGLNIFVSVLPELKKAKQAHSLCNFCFLGWPQENHLVTWNSLTFIIHTKHSIRLILFRTCWLFNTTSIFKIQRFVLFQLSVICSMKYDCIYKYRFTMEERMKFWGRPFNYYTAFSASRVVKQFCLSERMNRGNDEDAVGSVGELFARSIPTILYMR